MKKTALLVLLITVAVLFKVEIVKAESGGDLIEKDLFDTSLTVDYGRRKMNLTYYKANLAGIQIEWNKEDIKDLEINEIQKYIFTDKAYSAKFTYGIIDYLNLFMNVGAIFNEFKHEYIVAKSEVGIIGGGGIRGGYKFPVGLYIAGTGMFNMGRTSNYSFYNYTESRQNFYEWEGNLIFGYDMRVSQSFRIIPYLGGRYSDRYSKLELLNTTNNNSEYGEYWSKTKFGGFGGVEFRLTKQLSFKAEVGLGDKTGIGAALTYRFGIE